ncbi:hypothetical protein [Mycobacterium camsae]|uniref:hypothetical protein n=1 Tax=Mycobacterium gordonae TaxID=1778 RepID=UPI001980348A|nr:hypothetical protein [Mycobacterium gordonae]
MLGVVGTAAVLGALFGLSISLSLQVVDRSGSPIACGTGFHPDNRRAVREDAVNQDLHTSFGAPYEPSDYTDQCDALVAARRGISLKVLVFGGALLATTCVLGLRATGYRDLSGPGQPKRWVGAAASQPSVPYCDDLHQALGTIGIRVQH